MAGRARVAPRDPFRLHPVMLALGRARAARLLLEAAATSDYLTNGVSRMTAEAIEDAQETIEAMAFEQLDRALADAEAALRRSLTPEQAHAQVIGGPVAVS